MPQRVLDPKPILDLGLLEDAFDQHGINKKHALRIQRAYIQRGITDVAQIPDIPKKAVEVLASKFVLSTSKVVERHDSSDGSTTKLLVELQCGRRVESVIMRYGEVELRSFPEQEKKRQKPWQLITPGSIEADIDTASIASGSTDATSATRRFKSNKRATLCVSSQVGCLMGCTFCATGTMGLIDNLAAGEILEQLYHANQIEKIRNVVFMGMGEPLDNYDAVVAAVKGMTDPARFGLSGARISVSTVGVVPKIRRMMKDIPDVCLALSLHAPTQDLRIKIVPTAKAWPVERILEAADDFMTHQNDVVGNRTLDRHLENRDPNAPSKRQLAPRRKLLLEYVLLGPDVNCTPEVAHDLGKVIACSPDRLNHSILNVIPYNPTSAGVPYGYAPPAQDVINTFVDIVRSYGVTVMVRQELGQDVNAACGQLVVDSKCSTKDSSAGDIEDLGRKSASRSNTPGLVPRRKKQAIAPSNGSTSSSLPLKSQIKNKSSRFQNLLTILVLIFAARILLKLWTTLTVAQSKTGK